MKITLITVYDQCTQEFIDKYCDYLKKGPVKDRISLDLFRKGEIQIFQDLRPEYSATTSYQLEKEK